MPPFSNSQDIQDICYFSFLPSKTKVAWLHQKSKSMLCNNKYCYMFNLYNFKYIICFVCVKTNIDIFTNHEMAGNFMKSYFLKDFLTMYVHQALSF